jgi:hypothetical protein
VINGGSLMGIEILYASLRKSGTKRWIQTIRKGCKASGTGRLMMDRTNGTRIPLHRFPKTIRERVHCRGEFQGSLLSSIMAGYRGFAEESRLHNSPFVLR